MDSSGIPRPESSTVTKKSLWSASSVTRTHPSSTLYLIPFSTRLLMASVNFTSSTSALTGRKESRIREILLWSAIGRRRFRIFSSSSLIFILVIFISAAFLSIFTRESRSVIILFSLSISSVISERNSWYSSSGTPCCPTRESARTFMEVIGVFSSWDTLDTNSCLDSSRVFILESILLNASVISAVSV